jgi:hypothetical protein
MKAIYQNPTTDIITISVSQMIAATNNYGTPENGQDLNQAEETNATEGNLSRRRDIWADEEEDEDF